MNQILNIPVCFNIICIEMKDNKLIKIFIYNNTYFFKLVIKKELLFLNKNTNTIKIIKRQPESYKHIYNSSLIFFKFLKSINIYYYVKLKFKGKGYKINFYRNYNIIRFFFGKTHIQFFSLKKILIHRITKYKFMLQNTNKEKLNNLAIRMMRVRKINFYTMRGIRLSKMILIKRKGRKGAWS